MDTSEAEQWRSQQQESDQYQPSAKLPRLQPAAVDALALFAPTTEPMKASHMPPYSTPTASTFPRMGYFSLAQWQELELQALIYKYMLAGAPVPVELILPIRKNLLLTGIPYYHHHSQQYHHLQQAILPTGYWGRCVIDPEPGRCRRTDGKKWRCSREVVPGQKYCERHVHRGRNRSRKHVEIPTSSTGSGLKTTFPSSLMSTSKETPFTLSGSSPPLDILPLNQRPDSKPANGCLPQSYSSSFTSQDFQENRSDCRVLRKFFDDWPRSQQEPSANNASSATSTTSLSISISGNSTSDFSLKLSTGNSDPKPGQVADEATADESVQQPPPANWSGWGNHGEASMGGPLAEALRSSTSTPSPTSVLQKANGCV